MHAAKKQLELLLQKEIVRNGKMALRVAVLLWSELLIAFRGVQI